MQVTPVGRDSHLDRKLSGVGPPDPLGEETSDW